MTSRELVKLRTEHGLTQTQLAELIKVDQSTVAKWESGDRPIVAARADHIRLRVQIHAEGAA